MSEESREFSAMKILGLIAVLFWFFDAVSYFQAYATEVMLFTTGDALLILFGILELVFALYVFLALKYWELIPIKLPFFWWILLILGVVSLIFGYLGGAILLHVTFNMQYWAGTVAIMAALGNFFSEKKGWKVSKMWALLGAAIGIYECILLFYGFSMGAPADYLVAGIFGLILCILLIIIIFDFVDIRIPYEWWVLLILGFMFFAWISLYASVFALAGYYLAGWAGFTLLIAFVLVAFKY